MDQQERTPRQDKRKADLMEPDITQRQAPARPAVGLHAHQLNNTHQSSIPNHPAFHANSSNFGLTHPGSGNVQANPGQQAFTIYGGIVYADVGPSSSQNTSNSFPDTNPYSNQGIGPAQPASLQNVGGAFSNPMNTHLFPGSSIPGPSLFPNSMNPQSSFSHGHTGFAPTAAPSATLPLPPSQNFYPGHGDTSFVQNSSFGTAPTYTPNQQPQFGYSNNSVGQNANFSNVHFNPMNQGSMSQDVNVGLPPVSNFNNQYSNTNNQLPYATQSGYASLQNPNFNNSTFNPNNQPSFLTAHNTGNMADPDSSPQHDLQNVPPNTVQQSPFPQPNDTGIAGMASSSASPGPSSTPNNQMPFGASFNNGLPIRPRRQRPLIPNLDAIAAKSRARFAAAASSIASAQPEGTADSSASSSLPGPTATFPRDVATFPTGAFAGFGIADINTNRPSRPPKTRRSALNEQFAHSPYEPETHAILNLLLKHRDVVYQVCRWLPAEDLVNLYAISKHFHWTINLQLTTLIVGNAMTRMPESAEVFHFKCYKTLCMLDAAQNMSADKPTVRDVPSLRWLRFLEFRENTVQSILEQLALKGQRLPRAGSKVIKKIWFMMDVPDSQRRIGIIHNPDLWSNSELFIACMFFMKVDMAVTDPMLGGFHVKRFRQMMLGQRTLSVLDRVFKREMMRNQYEMLQMYTEWTIWLPHLVVPGEANPNFPRMMFGVPINQVGSLSRENWTFGRAPLARPDDIVTKETIRRGMNMEEKLFDLMLWGNTHPVTQADVFPRDWKGDIQTVFSDEVEDKVEKDIAIHVSREGTQFDWDKE